MKRTWGVRAIPRSIVVALCAAVVAWMSWPSFREPFFGEAFQHVGQWRLHDDNLFLASVAPTRDGWIKPVDVCVSLLVFWIAPLEPLLHHVFNFALVVGLIGVLLTMSARVSPSPWAPLLPIGWFSVSRVHLSTIGHLPSREDLLSALFILCCLMCLDRCVRTRSARPVWPSVAFGLLAIFTTERSIAVLPAVAAVLLCRGDPSVAWADRFKRAARQFVPFAAGAILLIAARWWFAGSVWPTAPRFRLEFLSSLSNTSFGDPGRLGVGGIGWWFGHAGAVPPRAGVAIDAVLASLTVAVLIAAMVRQRRHLAAAAGGLGLVAGSLIVHMMTPAQNPADTLLCAAGAAMVLMVLIAHSSTTARGIAASLVAMVAVNGFVGNRYSAYDWQSMARDAGHATPVLVDVIQASNASSFGLVTSRPDYWSRVLGSGAAPMLTELTGRRDIGIRYVTPAEYAKRATFDHDGPLYISIDNGVRLSEDRVTGELAIAALYPDQTMAGTPFNVQANGTAALAVVGEQFTRSTIIFFNDVELVSTYGNPTLMTAWVPEKLFATPGRYPIYLEDGGRRSPAAYFDVLPRAGP